jgi:hypothetical protein
MKASRGSETNKHLSGGRRRVLLFQVEMCTFGGEEGENKTKKFVAPHDKINDDECFKQKLSISMSAHFCVVSCWAGKTSQKEVKSKSRSQHTPSSLMAFY